MSERSSGDVWKQECVPSLVSFSEDETEVEPEYIDGSFPWSDNLCFFKNFERQVETWRILEESYRSDAFSAMKKLLLSPFMFQKLLIPEKWLIWAKDMDMIDYTVSDRNSLIKTDISRYHYLAVRMIDLAMTKLTQITRQNRNAVSILKIIWKIREYDIHKAINYVTEERLTKEFAKWLTTCMKGYVTGKDEEYVNSFQRQVLVSLLCWRQFSEVIYIITSEGRDIVKEVKKYYNENRDEVTDQLTAQARIDGNYHYGNGEYHMAFQKYSDAINKNPFVAVLYSNRCQASIKLKDFKTAVCDGYRAVLLKPGWVKVNYRLVNCLNLLQYYDEAIEVCRIGLEQCRSDPEIEKLHSLYNKLKTSVVEQYVKAHEVLHFIHDKTSEQNAEAKKKSRKKKAKRKLRKDDIEETNIDSCSSNSYKNGSNEGKTNNKNQRRENQSPNEIETRDIEKTSQSRTQTEKETLKNVFLLKNTSENGEERGTSKSKGNEESMVKCKTEKEKKRENEDKLSTSLKTKEKKKESVKTKQKTISTSEKQTPKVPVENTHEKTVIETPQVKHLKTDGKENCIETEKVITKAEQVLTKTLEKATSTTTTNLENISTTKKENKEKPKATVIEEYVRFIKSGSSELIEKKYVDASVSYGHAIELVDKKTFGIYSCIVVRVFKIFSVNLSDYAVLLYARGTVSLMQDLPYEVSISVRYYKRVLRELLEFEHRSMVHYGLAKAFYLLNSFYDATKEVLIALELIKSNPANRLLNWPGSKTTIPESDENHLSHKLQQLLQQCRSRPRPDAFCLFEECVKHYQKKEIYHSDIHFEGYIVISCHWKCKLHFHQKCWLGLKEKLNISGDKEILDETCLTPDCEGKIILYEKISNQGVCSKKINSKLNHPSINSSKKENKIPLTKYEKRTSKSRLNLFRRRKAIEILKRRKRERKNAKSETDEIQRPADVARKEKINRLGINPEQDLSGATIYLKHDEDDHDSKRISKSKMKLKANKRSVPVSFQYFCSQLPGYRQDMSMHEIDEAIERARESGSPFQLPDDLRQEIQEFESALSGKRSTVFTEEERMKVPFLFEYFQDFLSQRGPLKIDNKLFNDQVSLLPPDWQDVISKSGGLLSFLNSSSSFMLVPPFIGTKTQQITMKQMVDGDILPPRDSISSRSSSLDLSVFPEFPCQMSAFAEDFYRVGAPNNEKYIQEFINGTEEITSGIQQFLNSNSSNSSASNRFFYEDATSTSEESFDYIENEKTMINEAACSPTKSVESNNQAYEFLPSISNCAEPSQDLHQNAKSLEITFNVCDVGTQTENDEIEKAKEAVKRLQERLEVMETTCTKLKRTSQIREDSLMKQLEEVKALEKAAQEDAEAMRRQSEVESAKLSQEKKTLKEKLQMIKAKETECENSVELYKEKLKKAQEEREKDAILIMQLESMKKRNEEEKEKNLHRAIKAELDLVKKKRSVIVGINSQAKYECIQVVSDFERAITHVGIKAGLVLRKLAEGRQCWLRNVKICEENIDTLDSAYSSITKQVTSGVPLFELPQVPDLHPPPPGPNLQQILHFRQVAERGNGDGPVLAGRMMTGLRPVCPVPAIPNGPIRPPPPRPVLNSVTHDFKLQNILRARQPIDAAKQQDEQKMKKSNFQNLVSKLYKKFPNLSREQIEQLAQRVRAENGGLSGLLYEEIEQRVALLVAGRRDKPQEAVSMNATAQSASVSWNAMTPTSEIDVTPDADLFDGEEEEDVLCPICCDPLYEGRVHVLECEHRFHYECINKWMQKQRTCPNCRKFMSDPSEFPSLGNGVTLTTSH